ncbi:MULTISPECIES: ExbD/TolR family protein [Fusobacterium]|uniref:ExbD/TolR family protein n=1 Tax=Fusobacterium TaxID=848 RepID=UPI0015A7180B|nr:MULTISPECIES: biopolymer transporter ExbD [Fusobacterium]MCF2613030.1 biopolymer transporter ExbD [Fusobacterium perfoetens]MDY2980792.1 biopolymer transporter ExbD [Fusobacterium sp.]
MKIERYRRRNNQNIILEMTPLIDVVFLLLIFFLVATTFEDIDTGIKIDLPQSTIREVKTVKEVQLSLTNSKEIFLKYQDGKENKKILIKKANLKRELSKVLAESENKAVVISGDKTLDYGFIVEIMTLSKEAGAEQLDIDTVFQK